VIDPDAEIRSWLPIVWYNRFRTDLPDLCLGRWPPGITTVTPWKLWVVETDAERAALLAALARPVPRRDGALDFRSGPDAAVSQPGSGDTVMALYEPPSPGWPWITLGRWPREIGRQYGAERETYTWDVDLSSEDAVDRLSRNIGEGIRLADFIAKPAVGNA